MSSWSILATTTNILYKQLLEVYYNPQALTQIQVHSFFFTLVTRWDGYSMRPVKDQIKESIDILEKTLPAATSTETDFLHARLTHKMYKGEHKQ